MRSWFVAGRWARLALAAAIPPALFALGALCWLAAERRYFANATVLALVAAWLAAARPARLPAQVDIPIGPAKLEAGTEHALRTMLDQTPAPLLAMDGRGSLRAVNRAARRLFCTDDLVAAPPVLVRAMADSPAGQRTTLTLPGPGHGTAGRAYALSVARIIGPDGPLGLGVLTDIQSELHANEAQTLRSLLDVLGHEMMNSLTPVTSLAETALAMLAEDGAAGVAPAADALAVIVRRARGLDRFVQGYRSLARLPPPQLRPISIATLLGDAAALFRTRWRGVALLVVGPEPDIVVRADADQLSHALLNLLANAAEAALAGGLAPQVELRATADGSTVTLIVADNGPGVAEAECEAIFRPFHTGKPDGSGIGLAIARQVALGHGGSLLLDAAGAPGAVFRLSF